MTRCQKFCKLLVSVEEVPEIVMKGVILIPIVIVLSPAMFICFLFDWIGKKIKTCARKTI